MTIHSEPALSIERPFPGLRPFTFADRDFFFGREEQTYALYRLIDRGRFTAVVGSSGSGKSSLVRAGLRGLLEKESGEAGGRRWVCREMRPGAAPLDRLVACLADLSDDEDADIAGARAERIAYRLRQSSFGVADALAEVEGLENASLLLIVDQFEELFRYGAASTGQRRRKLEDVKSRDEAAQFVQLLLDVDRRRSGNVHVLLTMRSDFIGDCARFHGLSEAVSASQFLVPSLTRDQLDQVIREPVAKAGATIEPALVERLLNDSTDEPDQLPILQHCLLRLWESADGTQTSDSAERPVAPGDAPAGADAPPPGDGRHLAYANYEAIGGTEALSRHADDILASLGEREMAVEQVIRALAEIDREGRAIRRAVPFSQLLAETGVAEPELRRILDRFRADDCSFLTPSVSAVPELAADTPVDVGHEALLRRWKRVSGDPDALEQDGAAVRPIGWLRAEESDGQRYRLLLSMLDGESASRGATPLHRLDEWWTWWNSRLRTPAWAARYGGRFQAVQQFLEDALAAQARAQKEARAARSRAKLARRVRRAIYAAVPIVALAIAGSVYYVYQQLRSSTANFTLAVSTAQTFLDQVLSSYNSGTISVKGATALAATAETVVSQVRDIKRTPESNGLLVKLWLVEADLAFVVGDISKALKLAGEAKAAAQDLVALDPNNADRLQFVYASSLRIGDALAALPRVANSRARSSQEYILTQQVAEQIVRLKPDDRARKVDLAQVHNKLGDLEFIQRRYPGALDEYAAARAIADALVAAGPKARDGLWLRGVTQFRIGQAQLALKHWDDAYTAFHAAQVDQEELLQNEPEDNVLQSNLAASHTHLADLWKQQGKLDKALAEYRIGLSMLEALSRHDPSNSQWQMYLVADYTGIAGVLTDLDQAPEAIDYYRKTVGLRRDLATKDPGSIRRQQAYATSLEQLADNLKAPDQSTERLEAYRAALAIREKLAKDDPTNEDLQVALLTCHIKLGDALAPATDQVAAAVEQYRAALTILEPLIATKPDTVAWNRLHLEAEQKIQQLAAKR